MGSRSPGTRRVSECIVEEMIVRAQNRENVLQGEKGAQNENRGKKASMRCCRISLRD